ncbi:MAG: hypothetical protein HYR70_11035 [Chloroflexi bacterium]|nr:hypothetical protein [Chloroflexota bacterium]MBI2757334.1 hypothetical protein [Chloroflexota bacterium]MBI3340073.1 hypothetical protein [Chloroflexota bacterium]
MKFPSTISGWCMWLFFLLSGIAAFWAFPYAAPVIGILALGYAVLALIGQ